MPPIIIPSAALERFLGELGARRSVLNAGFSRLLIVDPAMALREWNVQGQAVKNECNVTIDVRFDEQSGEAYPLGPRRKIRRSFSRLFVTYARNVDTEPAVDGKLRSFSDADVDDDDQPPGDKAPVTDPIVMDAPAQVTVGIASALALAADLARRFWYVQNVSTAGQRISIGFNGQTAVLDFGVTVKVDGFRQQCAPEPNIQGAMNAIADAAGAKLAIQTGT